MKTIVYAESPYQLLNALDFIALSDYKEKKILIRNNGNGIQLKQFYEIVKKIEEDKISYAFLPEKGLFKSLLLLRLSFFLFLNGFKYREIILGDARSIVSRVLLPVFRLMRIKVVLVDDGLYLLTFVNRIRKCNYTVYTSLPIEKSIETFSDNKLEIINKKHLKAEMIDGNSINIIGMKLSEIGFMDEEIYLEILDKTVREYPTATINYYPHRGESENKLRKISDQGYIIHKNNLPIEEFFLKNGAPRGIYLTFYSTALYNLSNMLDKCVFYAIEPNITFWPEKHRKGISMCYDLFRAAGIHTRQIKLGIINA